MRAISPLTISEQEHMIHKCSITFLGQLAIIFELKFVVTAPHSLTSSVDTVLATLGIICVINRNQEGGDNLLQLTDLFRCDAVHHVSI